MNGSDKTLDEAIERILTWRATRPVPVGLLEQISADIDADVRRGGRRRGFFGGIGRMGRLALVGIALAALVAAAVGAWGAAGGKLQVAAPSPAVSAGPARSSLGLVYCMQPRPAPFDASSIDLTGTWTDHSELFYFRQEGNVLWGVALQVLAQGDVFDPANSSFTAFHGTVGPGLVVHLDHGSVGAVNRTDTRTPPLGNGSMDLRIDRGPDGNIQLTTTAQSGSDQLAGPAFGNPVFTACTPTVQ